MFFPDLSPYAYSVPEPLSGIVHVGWLDRAHPFTIGDLSAARVRKLAELAATTRTRVTRGYHACELCGAEHPIELEVRGQAHLLGHAEIWIRDPATGLVYAAPQLIVHYVERHAYRPPDPFLDALDAFDPRTWDAAAHAAERIETATREHARRIVLDDLEPRIRAELAASAPDVRVERITLRRNERLRLERKLVDHVRHLVLTPIELDRDAGIDLESADDIGIALARSGSSRPRDDFEARLVGGQRYARMVVRAWLVELRPWESIPRADAGNGA